MSDETTPQGEGVQAPQEAPKVTQAPVMAHNQRLNNKFAVGDEVWAVVALGPDLKVGKYPIKGMNVEFLADNGKWVYMYHLPVGQDGHADGINMTVTPEHLLSFNREEAEKQAQGVVADIVKEYDITIASKTKEYEEQMEDSKNKFERMIAQFMEEKEKCNVDDLVIQPREVSPANPADSPEAKVADKVTRQEAHKETMAKIDKEEAEEDAAFKEADKNCVCPKDSDDCECGAHAKSDPIDPDADCLICSMKPDQCVCASPSSAPKPNQEPNEPETTNTEAKPETTNQEGEEAKSPEEEKAPQPDGSPSSDSEQPA